MKAVRFVGRRTCTDPVYLAACGGAGAAVIDALPEGGNVSLGFKLPPRRVQINFPDRARDLLELGVAIYIADEISRRGDAPDGWTRSFELVFPVSEPELWAEAEGSLVDMLAMLSGDQFSFRWPERGRLPLVGRHRTRLPRGCSAVCLFSGGIDSLLGAHQLLLAGKRILLVGHQADPVTASAQTALFKGLARLFPGSVHLVQTRVARSRTSSARFVLPAKVEETHRPRSFLFLSIAAAIARTVGIQELYIPENGLIALNPPLQVSRIGSLSTRTAHPVFLTRFAQLLSELDLYTGRLANPFMYQSKTDMVAAAEHSLAPLLLRSVSCARPSRHNDLGVRHCGYCVACLYRRAAMAAAGLDRPRDYAFDVFRALASCTPHAQIDFRAMVDFARRLQRSTVLERELLVLSHGSFSPEVGAHLGPEPASGYTPWTDMLFRWSEQFIDLLYSKCSPPTKAILSLPRRRVPRAGR